MNIEIKKSIKPIKYEDAIKLLEERVLEINSGQKEELIWVVIPFNRHSLLITYH